MLREIDNISGNTQNIKITAPKSTESVQTAALKQTEKTNEDEFLEIKTAADTKEDGQKDKIDSLRMEFLEEQNEYFKEQEELISLQKECRDLKNEIAKYKKDKKNTKSLNSKLSSINQQIIITRRNIRACRDNMCNINIQMLNMINTISNSTASLNSISILEPVAQKTDSPEANIKYNGESIPKALAQKLDAKLGEGFSKKCESTAAKINCNVNDLLAMMYSESQISPNAKNSSGAVGLIQFMPSTLSANGYSSSSVANMSAVKQLDVVADIMVKSKLMSGYSKDDKIDAGSLYAICFLPAAAKSEVLCSKTGKLSWAYKANSALDLNSDGNISKSDLATRLNGKYTEMLKSFNIKNT